MELGHNSHILFFFLAITIGALKEFHRVISSQILRLVASAKVWCERENHCLKRATYAWYVFPKLFSIQPRNPFRKNCVVSMCRILIIRISSR